MASSNLNNTNAHGIKCEGIWFYPEPELPTMYKNPFMPPFNPVPIKDVHYCIHYFPDGSWLLKPIQGMMTQQMWSGLVGRVHFHNLIIHNINMQAQLHNSQALERNAEPPIVLDSHYSTQESWRSISNNVQTAAPCVTTATFQRKLREDWNNMTEDEKTDNVALQRRPFSSGRGQGRPQERESRPKYRGYYNRVYNEDGAKNRNCDTDDN